MIGVLPAAPVPYTPYDGPVCADGDPQCIVEVIAKMEDRLAPLAASCDHDAIFSLAYLRVTQNVKAAADAGYFHDRTWLTQLDAVFAGMYFTTMDTWSSGHRAQVTPAWRIALEASDDRSMTGLGDFLLNMNAHINNDFPHALATVGLGAKDDKTHKPDHNAYNDRLDSLYVPVLRRSPSGSTRPSTSTTWDRSTTSGWARSCAAGARWCGGTQRAMVTAKTPAQKALAEQAIEQYAAGQAALIRQTFASSDGSTARDTYCKSHG